MSAYAILIGTKGGAREAVLIGDPHTVKTAFKDAVAAGSDFDSLEVIDTRQGRTKRKTFKAAITVPQPVKPETAAQRKAREKREAAEADRLKAEQDAAGDGGAIEGEGEGGELQDGGNPADELDPSNVSSD